MPAGTKTSKVADNEVDLLAEMSQESSTPVDDDEDFDLLSDMSESDAKAWVPWNEEDHPNGIQGTVVHIGTVTQEERYGGNDVPYVEIRDKEGTVWGVRGYSSVLESQLQKEIDKGLRTGDILAVVHRGLTFNKSKTSEYRNFATKSRHIGH